MGREQRGAGGDDDIESPVDPQNTESTANTPSQTTFENSSEPTDSAQEVSHDDSDGISIRDRLQTESSGGVFANRSSVEVSTQDFLQPVVGVESQAEEVQITL